MQKSNDYPKERFTTRLVIGVFVITLVSTLMYNWYSWSSNPVVGIFAPTNSSLWQQMKLIVFPLLIYSLILWISFSKFLNNFFIGLLLASLAAVFFMLFWVSLYQYLDGSSNIFADIMLFIVSIVIAMIVLHIVFTAKKENLGVEVLALVAYMVLIFLLIWWTYDPPCNCGIWKVY